MVGAVLKARQRLCITADDAGCFGDTLDQTLAELETAGVENQPRGHPAMTLEDQLTTPSAGSGQAAGSALWQPQAHMPSVAGDRLVIVKGDGARVQTSAGDWLLDATAGLWHANIGHSRARLADAA